MHPIIENYQPTFAKFEVKGKPFPYQGYTCIILNEKAGIGERILDGIVALVATFFTAFLALKTKEIQQLWKIALDGVIKTHYVDYSTLPSTIKKAHRISSPSFQVCLPPHEQEDSKPYTGKSQQSDQTKSQKSNSSSKTQPQISLDSFPRDEEMSTKQTVTSQTNIQSSYIQPAICQPYYGNSAPTLSKTKPSPTTAPFPTMIAQPQTISQHFTLNLIDPKTPTTADYYLARFRKEGNLLDLTKNGDAKIVKKEYYANYQEWTITYLTIGNESLELNSLNANNLIIEQPFPRMYTVTNIGANKADIISLKGTKLEWSSANTIPSSFADKLMYANSIPFLNLTTNNSLSIKWEPRDGHLSHYFLSINGKKVDLNVDWFDKELEMLCIEDKANEPDHYIIAIKYSNHIVKEELHV